MNSRASPALRAIERYDRGSWSYYERSDRTLLVLSSSPRTDRSRVDRWSPDRWITVRVEEELEERSRNPHQSK